MVLWVFGPFSEVVMLVLQSTWRYLVVSATLGMISLVLGCGGKTVATTTPTPVYTVSGTVKYTRVPLVKDPVSGVPTGLETDPAKFVELPARGILVRAIQGKDETDATGATVKVWRDVGSMYTDSTGAYKLNVEGTYDTFIEVVGILQYSSGNQVRIIPTDITSSQPIVDRPLLALRKGADGSSPAGNATPGVVVTANSTVDFNVGLNTIWWQTPQTLSLIKTDSVAESTGSGSRILGILDTAYTFAAAFGNPAPGNTMNLHYQAGSTWAFGNRPSFVEYDTSKYPKSFDGGSYQFFGAIRAETASGKDDTWNEAALFSLFARNSVVRQGISRALPTQSRVDGTDLQDLAPDMAVLEGFVPAIAAVLMKSPYLAQDLATVPVVRDVRVRTGLGSDAYSAGNIAALSWEIALKSNSLPSPGTPTDWAKLDPLASGRYFTAILPKDDGSYPIDTVNIYAQIGRLKEAKAGTDSVDLAAIFTDAALTTLLTPFNITWPRPTTLPESKFLVDWGKDPNTSATALPVFTLSMANAHLNGELTPVYPNHSKAEILQARFTLSKDRKYRLTVQTPGGIPAGAEVEVIIAGNTSRFSSSVSSVDDFWLIGNATTPTFQSVRVRLLSPSVQQPDLPITLGLVALN